MSVAVILNEKSIRGIKAKISEQEIVDHVVPELSLFVDSARDNGAKTWRLQVNALNVKGTLGIGQYPAISLREARKEARRILTNIKNDLKFSNECLEKTSRVFKPIENNDFPMLHKDKKENPTFVTSKKGAKAKFKPSPMFDKKVKKSSERVVSDTRLLKQKEEARLKIEFDRKIETELKNAWDQYIKTQNPKILAEFLRSELLTKRPLSKEMGQEIANLLDSIVFQSNEINEADDDRIFMTYWRHTEFKNGVEPLVIDLEAAQECVNFMNAVGRTKSLESVCFRIKEHYSDWRKLNLIKLKKSAKILEEMTESRENEED